MYQIITQYLTNRHNFNMSIKYCLEKQNNEIIVVLGSNCRLVFSGLIGHLPYFWSCSSICIYVGVCVQVCVLEWVYACVFVCCVSCMCVYVYVCLYKCVFVYMYVCASFHLSVIAEVVCCRPMDHFRCWVIFNCWIEMALTHIL